MTHRICRFRGILSGLLLRVASALQNVSNGKLIANMSTGSPVSAEEKSATSVSLTTEADYETKLLDEFFPRIDLVTVMVSMAPSMKAMTIGYLCSQGLFCLFGFFNIYSALLALCVCSAMVVSVAIALTIIFERNRRTNLNNEEIRNKLLSIIYVAHPEKAPK